MLTLAGHLDEMPARLLALPAGDRVRGAAVELARLVLLARAFRADPRDPELRRVVATAKSREALLADSSTPRVTAPWEVLAEQARTRRDGLVSQTTWLLNLGVAGPRFAMLLDFFPAGTGRRGPRLRPASSSAACLPSTRRAIPCGPCWCSGTRRWRTPMDDGVSSCATRNVCEHGPPRTSP